MERRRRSGTITLRRYSTSACTITLVIINILTSLYFSLHQFPSIVFPYFPFWYSIVSLVFIVTTIFIGYVFYLQRLYLMNTILNVCATLLIVQFLFGFTVIVSFVIRVDKRIDILKNDGNNDDYALEYFQNKFACNSGDSTVTPGTIIPYLDHLLTEKSPILLSESCIIEIRVYARDVAVYLSTGYLCSATLLCTLILIIIFYYKNPVLR